jgi:hypothetical protein
MRVRVLLTDGWWSHLLVARARALAHTAHGAVALLAVVNFATVSHSSRGMHDVTLREIPGRHDVVNVAMCACEFLACAYHAFTAALAVVAPRDAATVGVLAFLPGPVIVVALAHVVTGHVDVFSTVITLEFVALRTSLDSGFRLLWHLPALGLAVAFLLERHLE